MAASALANAGGMTQPSNDMWNQYSQAVNEFMSMQSKTIDKLLDRTYTTNHSTQGKKSVQIDDSDTLKGSMEELDVQGVNEMDTATNPMMDDAGNDSETEREEKTQNVRAKRERRPAPRKMASRTSGVKSPQVDDEETDDEEITHTRQRKMSRNGHAQASRSLPTPRNETAPPTPGQKLYSDSGAIDLASYYK
tara:strand:+ start:270 stop:848 length:579 start_codon:yes stop_codon:yes gene_type:complete